MAEILNIRALPETAPANRTPSRKPASTETAASSANVGADEAVFSPEAQTAVEAARLRTLAEKPESPERAEELERVRDRLRDGAYRVQETLLQVATRVLPVVEQQI